MDSHASITRGRSLLLCTAAIALLLAGSASQAQAQADRVAAVGDDAWGQLGIGEDTWSPCRSLIDHAVSIARGGYHSLALKDDGTVWAWGNNEAGQLGDGTARPGYRSTGVYGGATGFYYRSTPAQVAGLTGVVAIAAGSYHSLALKNDGTVWAWGDNYCGQLGDGTTVSRFVPVQVASLTGVVAIAGAGYHSLALKNDGTVWGWGYNYYRQLGDGTTTNRFTPVQAAGLTGVTAIAGGSNHSLAVKNDGTAWAWGENCYGQLGDGTDTDRSRPVRVPGLTGVTAIAGGYFHTLALKNDGTVWAWGYNSYGELGDGTTTSRGTPLQVAGLTGVTAIAGGDHHSLALKNDGTACAWGQNFYGQVGDGTAIHRSVPVQVAGLTGAAAIAGGSSHSLALKNDGTVWAWGYNYYGQLGDGTTASRRMPVQLAGLTGVAAIAGGSSHSLALKDNGTVWAWGDGHHGQLGDGTTASRSVPVQVAGLTGVTAIAKGGLQHSLALTSDGTVWAWGYNCYGQLGDGTTAERSTPVQVAGQTGVTAIAAGCMYHSLALRNDGTVWAWGANSNGQLGDGTTTNRFTPVQVAGLSGVTAIAGGSYHSLALKNDGTVWGWGGNYSGELGDGTTTQRSMPVQVPGLTGVTAIAAGFQSLALTSDGTVWAWGDNRLYTILGDRTPFIHSTPVQVGLTGVTAIAGGSYHSLALKNDGTVWAWGDNRHGQLGDGTDTDRSMPIQMAGVTGATAIAGGGYHSLFLGLPLPPPPVGVLHAISRKMHGTAGVRDMDVQAGGAIESRVNGPTSLIVVFDRKIQGLGGLDNSDVALSSGTVTNVAIDFGKQLTVGLSGVANAAPLTVSFPGIVAADDPGIPVIDTLCIGVLVGDADRNGTVNSLDYLDGWVGQPVSNRNLWCDITVDGFINESDFIAIGDRIGTTLATTCPFAGVPEPTMEISPAVDFAILGQVGGPFTPQCMTYTLHNGDTSSLNWTATKTQEWLTVTPSAGTLAGGASVDVGVCVNAIANGLEMGTYTDQVVFTNSTSGSVEIPDVSLRVGYIDCFTELFATGNDLAHTTVTLTPDGSMHYYGACTTPAAAFPTDPTGGSPLGLTGDTTLKMTLAQGATVSIYEQAYSEFYVGSNGYVTFSTGDADATESLTDHFRLKRISGLFTDLDPAADQVTYKRLLDRVAITWQNVEAVGTSGGNSFQIELFYDGRIRLTWLDLAAADGLAGLSRGTGQPADFVMSNLTGYAPCPTAPHPGDADADADIDQGDFGHFQACLTTPGVFAVNPLCNDADLDMDGDVDEQDLQRFIRCKAGPEMPIPAGCLH